MLIIILCVIMSVYKSRTVIGVPNVTFTVVVRKVWNVQTGQKLHKLAAVSETEVTGLFHLPDRKLILAVGWNRLIVQYDDSDADVRLVLTADVLGPLFAMTSRRPCYRRCRNDIQEDYSMNDSAPYLTLIAHY